MRRLILKPPELRITVTGVALTLLLIPLSGCVVTSVVGAVADVAVDTAELAVKVPVKAGELAVDSVSPGDDKTKKKPAETATSTPTP